MYHERSVFLLCINHFSSFTSRDIGSRGDDISLYTKRKIFKMPTNIWTQINKCTYTHGAWHVSVFITSVFTVLHSVNQISILCSELISKLNFFINSYIFVLHMQCILFAFICNFLFFSPIITNNQSRIYAIYSVSNCMWYQLQMLPNYIYNCHA